MGEPAYHPRSRWPDALLPWESQTGAGDQVAGVSREGPRSVGQPSVMALWPQTNVQKEPALWKAEDPQNSSGAGRDLLCGIVLVKDLKSHHVPGLMPSNSSDLTARAI